ncbi:MAG: radical SAM protein [Clostridia bacterium]|nr:radical SAM protein [Clostridia bacterium]
MNNGENLYPLLQLERLRMETDGPGVTTLVAGAGCPLKCVYCLNKRILKEKTPEWVTPDELFRRTCIDDLYFQATGGGLCFGGGESLLHARFISAFREKCGDAWKLTAETSLHVPAAQLKTAIGAVDHYLVDIKTLDPDIYRKYTGADLDPVLHNLKLLAGAVSPERVTVRIPLIPSYNDEADRRRSEGLLAAMGFTTFDFFTYRIL